METKTSLRTIREIDYAIAFTSGQGNVYINKYLKEYNKELYDKILKHELSHDTGSYNVHDLEEDMSIDFMPLSEKIKFCMKYPKGFLYLSPILITEDEIVINGLGIFKLITIISLIILLIVAFGGG